LSFATKCNRVRQGQWCYVGHLHPEGYGDTRPHCWTKLLFTTRHKSLEGVFLPESPPRVSREPPFIQCLMTLTTLDREVFIKHIFTGIPKFS